MKTKVFVLSFLYWAAIISLTAVFFIYKIVPIAIIIVLGVILYPLILGNYKRELNEEKKNVDPKDS